MGNGRQQYPQKQDDLLATEVNLVEIDLLIDYSQPPSASLSDAEAIWADTLLRPIP